MFRARARKLGSGFVGGRLFFLDRHVLQFAGLEDVAAFAALQVFGLFVAGDDLHLRMLAPLAAGLLW